MVERNAGISRTSGRKFQILRKIRNLVYEIISNKNEKFSAENGNLNTVKIWNFLFERMNNLQESRRIIDQRRDIVAIVLYLYRTINVHIYNSKRNEHEINI